MSFTLPPRCARRYEVVQVFAAGAFGAVVEAVHRELKRKVAVKLLHANRLTDEVVVKRFLHEAQGTAALAHPNIVRVLDHDVDDGIPWIAYELVAGGNLADRVAQGPLPWREACRIALAVADALAEAHARGILHRDIKAANVLLGRDGAVKVADFGLARWDGALSVHTEAGTVMGSPAYMAPELVGGEAASPASDLYALAVMLFEAIAGERPYTADAPPMMLYKHVHAPVPGLKPRIPDLPAEVDRLVQRALAKTPAERPSLADFRAELTAVAVVPSSPEIVLPELVETARSSRPSRALSSPPTQEGRGAGATAAMALAAAIVVGTAIARWPAGRPPSPGPTVSPTVAPTQHVPPPPRIAPAERAAAAEDLHQLYLKTNVLPGYSELFEASLSSAGMMGHSQDELRALHAKAVSFAKAHAECTRLARRALARMRAAYPGPLGAPMEDLELLGDILGQAVVSPIQVVRGDWLAAQLKINDTTAFGILDSDVCIPQAALEPLSELADTAAAAMALAVRERPAGAERGLSVVHALHWAASYFVHNEVCHLKPGELGPRIRRRIEQAPGFPDDAPGRAARELVLRVWDIGLIGGGKQARRDLAGTLELVQAVAARLGGAPKPGADLIERIRDCAGGAKPR